jgi:polyisoprenoid-binding protein YceI
VVVDVASGNSDSDARDSRMHSVVLESKKFPDAVFAPDHIDGAVSLTRSSTVKIHGAFTIHGVPHDVVMDALTSVTGDEIHATLTFDIPYVAWGMKDPGNFMLKVNKTVKMTIETAAPLQKH